MHLSPYSHSKPDPPSPVSQERHAILNTLLSSKKTKSPQKHNPTFITEIFTLSNTVNTLIRKKLRICWRRMKAQMDERKWEEKVRERAKE